MPCYDARDKSTYSNSQINQLEDQVNLLSAYLCAIINEVKLNVTDLDEFIKSASHNGKCPKLIDWYKTHNDSDEIRLNTILKSKFSRHELEIIKNILNKNKI